MNSNSTRSERISPFLKACTWGCSPSTVRSRGTFIATLPKRLKASRVLGVVHVDESGLRQRLAHVVHVEPENAGSELLALAFLVGVALFGFLRDVGGILRRNHHDAIVVGDHHVARGDVDAA